MKSNKDRKVIQSKANGYKWELQFFKDIEAAILDGYRIADNNLREDQSMRNYRGKFGRAVLYREGEATDVLPTEEVLEVAEAVTESVSEELSTVVNEESTESESTSEEEEKEETEEVEVVKEDKPKRGRKPKTSQ